MRDELLLGQVYAAAEAPKQWPALVQALEARVGAPILLSLPHPRQRNGGHLVGPSFGAKALAEYRAGFFAADPFFPQGQGGPRAVPASCTFQVQPAPGARKALLESAFYRDWMQPQALAPRCLSGVLERDGAGAVARIAVFQPQGARSPGRAALRSLQRLGPHLARAVRIHFARERAEEEHDALMTACHRLPLGLLLIDRAGRVRALNRTAEAMLAERDGFELERDGVRVGQPEATRRLRQLLGAPAHPAGEPAPGFTSLQIPRSAGRRPLQALILPGRSGPHALSILFLADPSLRMDAPLELLRQLHDLTPSEAALARELARGRTLAEAAELLGVTVGTARQRLGQVFGKTATGRQAELVRALLAGLGQLRLDD